MILVWILLIAWALFLLLPRLMPRLMRWLAGRMRRRMMRSFMGSMGIDPEAYEREYRREQRRRTGHNPRASSHHSPRGRIIPEGYGEYVQFQVLSLTGNEPWLDTAASPLYVHYDEVQISEASYTIVK